MKIFTIVFSVIIFTTGAVLYATSHIGSVAGSKIYSSVETIPYNRVGVLLGVGKYTEQGYVNLYYTSRLEAAVDLYNAGKIERILVSGDNSRVGYDESTTFKDDLVAVGIPEQNIHLDFAGFRTRDSVIRANVVFGLNSFTVISQEFHNERAVYIAENLGLNVVGFNAAPVLGVHSRKTNAREYAARVKAIIDVWVDVQPKFLGETIDI